MIKSYKTTGNIFDTLRIGSRLSRFRRRTVTMPYRKRNYFNKGVRNMVNRNIAVACVGLGLFSTLFVGIAGKNLAAESVEVFNVLGLFAVAFGVLFHLLGTKTEEQQSREREDISRDIDAVYRYIDDRHRDMEDSVKDLRRQCEKGCSLPGKK